MLVSFLRKTICSGVAFACIWGVGARPTPLSSSLNEVLNRVYSVDMDKDEIVSSAKKASRAVADLWTEAPRLSQRVAMAKTVARVSVKSRSLPVDLSTPYQSWMNDDDLPADDESQTVNSAPSVNKSTLSSKIVLQLPLSGEIAAHFGQRIHPITQQEKNHNGIDIAASEGTAIKAANDGVVTQAGMAGTLGKAVFINGGDGIETRYGHMSAISVKVGEHVVAGQEIGLVGHTGQATGDHLHFEFRLNGNPLDPLAYLPPMKFN